MPDEKPVAFHNIPAYLYPFTVNFIDIDTEELLHTERIETGGVMSVPGFRPRRVGVEVLYANGMREWVEPHDGMEDV